MGCLKVSGYYALIDDIDNFPLLPAAPANAEDEVTLESTSGFKMKVSKNFSTIYSTIKTSEVIDENQGKPDGQSFVHKATIFYSARNPKPLHSPSM